MFRHACVMGLVGHRLEALRQLLQELPVPELGKVKTRLMPRACRRGNPAFGGERLCERLAVSQYPAGPHGLWLRYSEDECSRLFSMDHTIPPAIAATVTASATVSTFASSSSANKRRSGLVPVSTMAAACSATGQRLGRSVFAPMLTAAATAASRMGLKAPGRAWFACSSEEARV